MPYLAGRKRRRRGGVLVLVAFGMMTLLAMTAMVVDVNLWNLERAKIEQATSSAARAGFARLKDLDYNYTNPRTRRSVDATIREYLILNGVSEMEAANAKIKVNKRNVVSVTVRRVSGTFFARAADITSVSIAGGSRLQKVNDITPFAIPMKYQDDDHNQVPNFTAVMGKKGFVGSTEKYKLGKPYIIKFGKPLISLLDDMVLIPMESKEFVIPARAFANLKIPTGIGGKFEVCKTGYYIPAQHTNRSDIYKVGIFRAYGIAHTVLGGAKVDDETCSVR